MRFSIERVLQLEMNMIEDAELLRRYAETRSEEAFAELVGRHLNLVYSAVIRLQPCLNVFDQQPARLIARHVRVVDHFRAKRDHQWRCGTLAVTLIARSEVLIYAFSHTTFRALFKMRVEVILVVRLRKNIRADVATFHHQIAELDAIPLRLG